MKLPFMVGFVALAAALAGAHPPDEHGRHGQSHPPSRSWTNARTGASARGDFLAARTVEGAVKVIVESDDGSMVVFPLEDLAEPDRQEARKRIDEVGAINGALSGPGQPAGTGPAGPATPPRPPQAAPFDAFGPLVRTRWDSAWLYVESDGLPHKPWVYDLMVGIKSWQQQVPLPQDYTGDNAWRIPLKPELADKPVSGKKALFRGAIALAANGVPIFNALNNRGEDAFKAGELDEFGGHCGRGDDYHYHTAPLGIQKIVGADQPIAYALDGFPLYGLFDPKAKAGQEKACPLGGAETLDDLNGHFGAAPAGAPPDARGLYHYHASLTYPYINGGVRGRVSVRDDQIDPQPRARPVRPWLQPLRGAVITGFKTLAEKSWSLEYTLSGRKHRVNFRIEGSGAGASYVFDFIDPDGRAKTETYRTPPERSDRGRPPRGDRPAREGGAAPADRSAPRPATGLVLSSPDAPDGRLSVECTCDGSGRAPALAWSGGPKDAKAYAVIMHHTAPDGEVHVYLVAANLPPEPAELKSGDLKSGVRGQNTVNRRNEYAPPCSKGPGDKVYTITLFALSEEIKPAPGSALTRDSLLAAIKDRTLAAATLDVTYARRDSKGGR